MVALQWTFVAFLGAQAGGEGAGSRPGGAPPPPPNAAGDDRAITRPIARVNGTELTAGAFAEWLVAAHGWRHLDDFIDLALLRAEVEALGLPLLTAGEIETLFEEYWKDQIMLRYRGDERAFQDEIAKAGLDRTSFRDRRLGSLEQEELGRRILKRREPTAQTLRELFEKEFGKDGVRVHVRVAFFDKLKTLKPGQPIPKELIEQLDRTAKARAEAFLAEVRADRLQFAALVPTATDLVTIDRFDGIPVDLRTLAGEVPRLRGDHFQGVVLKALAATPPGGLAGPLAAPAGYYIVEVLAREPVTFETRQAELAEIWRTRIPSAGEVHWLKDELRTKAKIERLGLNAPAELAGKGKN